MVKITLLDTEATIDGFRWTSPDKGLQAMLNSMTDPAAIMSQEPHPDLTAAELVINQLPPFYEAQVVDEGEPLPLLTERQRQRQGVVY